MKKATLFLFILFAFYCLTPKTLNAWWFEKEQITMYSQRGCPHCQEAIKYINKYHPSLKIEIVELNGREAIKGLYACAEKFSIEKKRVGTPLICFKNDYIMGWSNANAQKFEKLVR